MEANYLGNCACSHKSKRLPKGKYKYVYPYIMPDKSIFYQAYISRFKWSKLFTSEREAAIAVDTYLLNKGKDAVNILIKK